MHIEKNKVVWFHYSMYEQDVKLEDSREHDPVLYLHGQGSIFAALEAALEGKVSGDTISITLEPEQAYGHRRDSPTQRIPIKHLIPNRKPRKGDVFQVETDHGHQNVIIMKVGKFNVDVDFNHPLAGKTLRFEIEVGNIRDATSEELDHGHAHGAGGHSH
jgi:FKBP-type peptidyl-prolyl cis-trans isomerase SlyD